MLKKILTITLLILLINLLTHTASAQSSGQNILNRILDPEIEVGTEIIDGYSQIFYQLGTEKKTITQGNLNSTLPFTEGDYIVYRTSINGTDQIFLYHIPSEQTIQLTNSSNNTNPKVSEDGRVVWERWANTNSIINTQSLLTPEPTLSATLSPTFSPTLSPTISPAVPISTPTAGLTPTTTPQQQTNTIEDQLVQNQSWQIVFFDGVKSKQITQTGVTINPVLEGNAILYSEKDENGVWTAKAYSILEDKIIDITTGDDAKLPFLEDGKIFLGTERKEFPLTVDDIMLLDLVPLSTDKPQTVTETDILEELAGLRNL